MGELISDPSEVPAASHYVLMRDTFLSNWGPAEGKDSIHVYPCDGEQEASVVVANAGARDDQDQIRVVRELPEFEADWVVSLVDREHAARWWEPEAFITEPCPDCEGEGCEECDDLGRVRKVNA
jgi:hypothetical protein